jgi:hypothetical protein
MDNSRLNVLKIPNRRHAGKTSMESVDMEYQKEQAKLEAKLKARHEILAAYEKRTLGGPHVSPVLPIVTKPSRIPRFDSAGPGTPTVPEDSEFRAPESIADSWADSTAVEVASEAAQTPAALAHRRRNSGTFNIFSSPAPVRGPKQYRLRPPFATDDETPRAVRSAKTVAPFATDDTAKFESYSEYRAASGRALEGDVTKLSIETEAKKDVEAKVAPAVAHATEDTGKPIRKPGFCWQWAFTDDDGNPLPEMDEEPEYTSKTVDFSLMSPRVPSYIEGTT